MSNTLCPRSTAQRFTGIQSSRACKREEDKREGDREIREGQTEIFAYGKREGVGERQIEGDMNGNREKR